MCFICITMLHVFIFRKISCVLLYDTLCESYVFYFNIFFMLIFNVIYLSEYMLRKDLA